MNAMLFPSTTGGLLIIVCQALAAQCDEISGKNNSCQDSTRHKTEASSEDVFFLWRDAHVTGGQITLPFKIRRSPEHNTFRLTTDITLGGYIGYTRRISQKHDYYLTVPLTAGLTFINLSDNNTSLDRAEALDEEVVPGLTWSTGLILQLEKYSLGLMFGKDYASSVGDQWEYHDKLWWSFGVGFVFLQ